jgi:hypothetical protein
VAHNLIAHKGLMAAFGLIAAHAAASLGFGQWNPSADYPTRLVPEDFAPFVFQPRVLLDASSRQGANATWIIDDDLSNQFLTIDPQGHTVVVCRKRSAGPASPPQQVRLNSEGEIVEIAPSRYTTQLPTGAVSATGQPVIAPVSFSLERQYPLVRDPQGGFHRTLAIGSNPTWGTHTVAVRTVGERVIVVNTAAGLGQHFGLNQVRFSSFWQGIHNENIYGIRHANGAWALSFEASNPIVSGLVLNLDVPFAGPPSADGRTPVLIRSTDRVRDGDWWMEVGRAFDSTWSPLNRIDYRYSSSGFASFSGMSRRYNTLVAPSNAQIVRALWMSTPNGLLSLAARELAAGEIPGPSLPDHVFRSLELSSLGMNTDGDIAFVSLGGMAKEPTSRPGVFIRPTGGALQRVLGPGDEVRPAPGQIAASPLTISTIPAAYRPQINDAGDLLAMASINGQTQQSLCLRLARPDRQSGLEGWVQVAGPGDRLLNAPQWRVTSIALQSPFNTTGPCASLNNKGQVFLEAIIENQWGLQTSAYLGFDPQCGLHLLWANNQPQRDPQTQALAMWQFFDLDGNVLGWHPTNAGFAERFNDAGQAVMYASKLFPTSSPWARYYVNAALLFTLKRACNRADLSGDLVPMVSDGVLDNHDAAAFVELFFQASPRADVTEDSSVDGADITRFIELMTTACE